MSERTNAILSGVATECFIGGSWREASSKERFSVLDPATEEIIAEVADGTAEDAELAVDAAHDAQRAWAKRPPRERAEILRRAFELMTERADRFARLIVLENGKALTDASGEVAYAAEFFRWYSEEAVRNIGELTRAPAGANRILVVHQPVGVAALVTPWNFPAAMLTRKIAPALAAGCAVVCKPAEDTPLTALAIAQVLEEAGAPAGVVNVVPTSKASAFVSTLLEDERVRKLSFTGSTEVGRALLAQGAERIVNCSMELGGNAPFLVLDDADLERAVAGAMIAKLRNGGEACTAANRFYVHEAVAEAFTAALCKQMGSLTMGHGLDDGVQIGPLVNEATKAKVASLVEGALDEGARVELGGSLPDGRGYFYPPTVLSKVAPDAAILNEEIFGPVAPIVTFSSDEEAIELANDTEYGLVSYLYSNDLRRALGVAEALEAGMVGVNRGLVSDPAAPFGGVKQSGLGREGSHEGMAEYLEAKYIACEW